MTDLTTTDSKITAFISAVIAAYLVPAWVYILFCIFLVLLDSFFGLLTIKKRGDEFSFKRLIFKGVILKFSVYFPMIIGAVKINELFLAPIIDTNIPLLLSLLFIFVYDIRSIWKHFIILRGGNVKEDKDFMASIFNWIRETIDLIQKK